MIFGNNVYNTLGGNSGTSFSPGISFGGATTGITYGLQFGYYQNIGNVLFYTIYIQLTSKGSATGTARIINSPILADGSNICRLPALTKNIDLPANYYTIFVVPTSSALTWSLVAGGNNNSILTLDDTVFSNYSEIISSGFYFV